MLRTKTTHIFYPYTTLFRSHVSDKLQKLIFDQKAEGLIAKRKKSTYQSGKEHHSWFKIKNWRHINGILHAYNVANDYFSISVRSEEHTSELQSRVQLVCRLL